MRREKVPGLGSLGDGDPLGFPRPFPRILLSPALVERNIQWPFQEPKLEVPIIYKAYFSGLNLNIPPKYGQQYGTVAPF